MRYHIRRLERAITDTNEIEAILARCRYADIALAVDNEPYIVTLTYGYLGHSWRKYSSSVICK